MKKIFISAALASLMMVGCQNEVIEGQSNNNGDMFTLEVVQGGSRTALDGNQTVWSNDDKIFVTSGDGKVSGVLHYKGNNKFAGHVFGGKTTRLSHVIFPVPVDGKVKLNQPTGDRLDLPMIGAFGDDKSTVAMANACALVNLPVEGVSSINLSSEGANTLNGHYEYQEGRFVFIPGKGGISVSVNEEGKAFFAVSTNIEGKEHPEVKLKVNNSEETITIPVEGGKISENNVPEIEVNENGVMEDATMNVTTPAVLEMALNQYAEVKLAGDIEIKEDIKITAEKNVTLDLNGYTLSGNIVNEGSLTVVNGNINKYASSFKVTGGVTYFKGGTYAENVTPAENYKTEQFNDKYIVLPNDAVVVKDVDGFKKALSSTNEVSLILIANDLTITEAWNSTHNCAVNVPVTIEGAGNTIAFTGAINDRNNYNSALKINNTAIIKNLNLDLSNARKTGGNMRAISTTSSLKVVNCSFIGNENETKTRGIIFGEGAKTLEGIEIEISGCSFANWGYGVTDNENGKLEVKAVLIDNNTFENGGVQISAYETITFVENTMESSSLTITSYTNAANAKVKVLGNTLDLNKKNQIGTSKHIFNFANVESQDGVSVFAE